MVKTKQPKKQAAPAKQDVLGTPSFKRTAKPTSSSASPSGNTLSRTRMSMRQVNKEENLTPETKNFTASMTPRNDLAGSSAPQAAASPAKNDHDEKSTSKVADKDVTKVEADEHQSKRRRKNTTPTVKEVKKKPAKKVVVDLSSSSSSSEDSSSDEEQINAKSEDEESDGESINSSETRSKDSDVSDASEDASSSSSGSSDSDKEDASDDASSSSSGSSDSDKEVDDSTTVQATMQTSLETPTETTYLGYAKKSHVFLVVMNSSCSLDGHSEMFDPEKNIRVLLKNYPGTPLDKGAAYAVSFDISGNGIGFIKVEFVKDAPLAPFNKMHLQLAQPPLKQVALTGQIRYIGDIQDLHQNNRILKHRSVEVWVMCADGVLEIVGITVWGTYTHHRDLTVNAILLFMGMTQTSYMGKTRFNLGERGAIANVSDVKAALKIKKKVTAIVGFDEAKAAASLPKGFKVIK